MALDRVDAVVNLSKRRGFVYPSSEIYGGTRSAWTTAPGVELQENVRRQWWRAMVQGREDVVGLDLGRDPRAAGVGGLRAPRHVHRPADRVPRATSGSERTSSSRPTSTSTARRPRAGLA